MADPKQSHAISDHVRNQLKARHAPELLYGAIVSGSVLALAGGHAGTYDQVAIAAILVSMVYWIAHIYVDAIGGRLFDRTHSMGYRLGASLRGNTAVLIGAAPPIVVFFACRRLGLEEVDAATVAAWSTVALLTAAGCSISFRVGARGWQLLWDSLVAGSFGLLVIALKFLAH